MRYSLSSISRQKQKKHVVVVEEGREAEEEEGVEGVVERKGKEEKGVIGEFALGVGKSEVQF